MTLPKSGTLMSDAKTPATPTTSAAPPNTRPAADQDLGGGRGPATRGEATFTEVASATGEAASIKERAMVTALTLTARGEAETLKRLSYRGSRRTW
jgi:hypothetical protein